MKPLDTLRTQAARLRIRTAQITAGGSWSDTLSRGTRRNLRWFWFDGLFSAASDNILLTYLVLYLLALGATSAQVGLLSSLSSLSATLMLLPGAILVERLGHRKQITLIAGGIIGRSMILLITLVPLFLSGQPAVYAAILISVLRDGFSNLALPAWVSLTANLVPLAWRGRYFAARNIAMGIAGMGVVLFLGEVITRTRQPAGYQIALGLAYFLGMTATFFYSRLREPPGSTVLPAVAARSPLDLKQVFTSLRQSPVFLAMCATAALWNLSLNIAGPFFNVYLVKNLQATPTMVAILATTASLSGLLSQTTFGALADRWGPRRVQLITGLLIPILPVSWVFVREPWQIIPLNLLSGSLWAGYTLASFNLLLLLTPEDLRARYTAIYQLLVSLSLAIGAAIGSLLVTQWGFDAVFIASGLGRLLAAFLFARYVPAPSPAPEQSQA
jgi:MFS family permease